MMSGSAIILYLLSLFVLYVIIEAAVRNGINNSVIGKQLKEKQGDQEKRDRFFDDDLDKD